MKRIIGSETEDPTQCQKPQFKFERVSDDVGKDPLSKNEEELINSLFDQNPIYNQTMSTLKQFSNYKLEMAMRQVKIEKKLSRALDDKIRQNLESLAVHEKNLKQQQSILQEKLDKATQDLLVSEKFSTIGELTSKFTHDVRNPLTVVQSQLDILQERLLQDDDKNSKIAFLRIFHALTGINHMIEQVLNYVRGKPLQLKHTRLLDLLELCIVGLPIPATIDILLPKKNVDVFCDDYQMGIVINNLILNAIESVGKDGKIEIKLTDNLDHTLIEIQDSGPGIPEDMLEKIFEPLITTKRTGTGLGLASCFRIVMQHQGTINVQNNPTVFSVKIPKHLKDSQSKNIPQSSPEIKREL